MVERNERSLELAPSSASNGRKNIGRAFLYCLLAGYLVAGWLYGNPKSSGYGATLLLDSLPGDCVHRAGEPGDFHAGGCASHE